jgi:murein DD-endopeptidase MepM/ murein hydrolase activator NlpD
MGQMNGAEDSDAYTVVIFRGSTAKPLRFSFRRKLVSKLLIVGAIFVLFDILVLSHYVIRTGEVWELSAFREEAMSAREQTGEFSSAVDDLKKRLTSMKEVNQRLRVMLGIENPKPGDVANGRGGEDTPLPDGNTLPAAERISQGDAGAQHFNSAETSQSALAGQVSPSAGSTGLTEQERIASIKDGIDWLSKEATIQEESLQELSLAAEKRSSRWAATPSIWPVKGWVTSGFGPRVSPFTEKPAWHDGLDIGAAANAPVQAPAQGRVTAVGFDPKLGILVKLDHGFGIETLYGGSTGLATGPHLHYMVKVHGQALDPVKYILE